MRQLATLTAAALFATVMGFGGTAWAQTDVLINGGAEAANGGEWVAVGGMDRNMSSSAGGLTVGPRTDSWMWDAGFASVGDGGTASLTQTVDVSGCNLFVNGVELQGAWNTSAWFATQDIPNHDDFGTFTIDFAGGPTNVQTDLLSKNAYSQVTDDGVLPLGATTADITIAGTQNGPGGEFADVLWDDVEFIIDCVAKTAKISGKFAADGKRPSHSFGGAVGLLEGGDIAAGSIITISYKKSVNPLSTGKNVSCDFTEDAGSTAIVGDVVTLTGWSYLCDNTGASTGTAILVLVDRDTDGPRGSICVDAESDDGLDIGGTDSLCDAPGDQELLDRGNVIVDDGA